MLKVVLKPAIKSNEHLNFFFKICRFLRAAVYEPARHRPPQIKRGLESEAENLCAHFSVHFRKTPPGKRGLRSFIKRPL